MAIIAPGEARLGVRSLTDRERELLAHMSSGLVFKQAAQQMGISVHSARGHWKRIKVKWEVNTIAQATAMFVTAAAPGASD